MTKSMTIVLAFGAALLFAQSALAFEGRYVAGSKSYRQELKIKKTADGRFAVEAVVGSPDCSGYVEAVAGAAEGDALKAEGKMDEETCALDIRRSTKGVTVTEQAHCSYFHGASCEFSGEYRKRR